LAAAGKTNRKSACQAVCVSKGLKEAGAGKREEAV